MANGGRTQKELLRPRYWVCNVRGSEIRGTDKLWTQCNAGGFVTSQERDQHEKECRANKGKLEHSIPTSTGNAA